MAAKPIQPPPVAMSYDVADLSRHVPEAVGQARDRHQPILITDQSGPLAALVRIEELERRYELPERAEMRQIVQDLEAAETRGDAEWYSPEQIVQLQAGLLAEQAANSRSSPRRSHALLGRPTPSRWP